MVVKDIDPIERAYSRPGKLTLDQENQEKKTGKLTITRKIKKLAKKITRKTAKWPGKPGKFYLR